MRDGRDAERETHLLGRHQAVVGLDEHVLLAADVHAARLEGGGVIHTRHDLLHLLGGHLRARDARGGEISRQIWVSNE